MLSTKLDHRATTSLPITLASEPRWIHRNRPSLPPHDLIFTGNRLFNPGGLMSQFESNAKPKGDLSVPLLVIFGLLAFALIPALPIYLWQKGRLSKNVGLGISGAMLVGFVAIGVFAPPPEESDPAAQADPTPAASESPSAEPVAAESPKVDESVALIAKAEEAASSELPDVPYWQGATFKGTAMSKSKVCVDRTKEDGTNAGFVVVTFPDESVGEPQDGTCGKPAPKPIDYEAILKKAVKKSLGGSNRDVKRVDSVVYNADNDAIVIRWAIDENLTNGMTKTGARMDIVDLLKVVQKFGKKYPVKTATFSGTYSLVDQLGNTSEDKVVQVEYPWSTVKQINFDNFNTDNVYKVADDSFIHPAFRD